MTGTRMFVAVVPPDEAVAHLDEHLDVRRGAGAFRWTDAEQLHVTLAFAAAVPDRAVDDLVERLEVAAARRRPVPTRVRGGGAFPHVAGARVLWAGLELDQDGRAELDRLAIGARNAVAAAGAQVDGQRFRPHLTVARMGRPTETTSWVRLLDAYEGPPWTVDRVELVASHLGQGRRRRPRYERVAEVPLAAG